MIQKFDFNGHVNPKFCLSFVHPACLSTLKWFHQWLKTQCSFETKSPPFPLSMLTTTPPPFTWPSGHVLSTPTHHSASTNVQGAGDTWKPLMTDVEIHSKFCLKINQNNTYTIRCHQNNGIFKQLPLNKCQIQGTVTSITAHTCSVFHKFHSQNLSIFH